MKRVARIFLTHQNGFKPFICTGMKGRLRIISIYACLDDPCGYDMREALALPFVSPGNPLTHIRKGDRIFLFEKKNVLFSRSRFFSRKEG